MNIILSNLLLILNNNINYRFFIYTFFYGIEFIRVNYYHSFFHSDGMSL